VRLPIKNHISIVFEGTITCKVLKIKVYLKINKNCYRYLCRLLGSMR
jgi:hypothetical protein